MTKDLIPSRRGEIDSFLAMDMLQAANRAEAKGTDVIHMEVGQPGSRAPRVVIEAAEQALRSDRIGYTEALGIPVLRERISRHYKETYGLDVDPERIVVTTGSSGGFLLAFLGLFDAGQTVALANPGYPAYRNIIASLDLQSAFIPTGQKNRWSPTVGEVESLPALSGLDGILLASPANPTGTMLPAETLRALIELCRTTGRWFISDEIYHGLTYDEPAATALQFSDDVVVINSFSKYYCMTGWRIGWMVVPPSMIRVFERLAQNLFISAPALSQTAAVAAFDASEDLEKIKAGYARNRNLLLEELPSMGLTETAPADGAFYIYADVSRFSNDSFSFAQTLLRDTGVAVTPGADFDPEQGNRYIRLSFAGEYDHMREACSRLRAFIS